jgi:hypothetical protein
VRASTIGFACAGVAIAAVTAFVLVERAKHDDAPAPIASSFELMPPVVVLPPPRHDVLVVAEPNDANVFADGSPLGLAPVTIDTHGRSIVLRVDHDGYLPFSATIDESTRARFVVMLEKQDDKRVRLARPPSCPAEDWDPFRGVCDRRHIQKSNDGTRPATCPPEFWDPFDRRCTMNQPDRTKPFML